MNSPQCWPKPAIPSSGAKPNAPWQRVINSQGKVSPRPGYGPLVQRTLLEQEGVAFDDKERVDLKKYGWNPRGPDRAEEEPQPRLF